MLLNPPGWEVYRDELSSSAESEGEKLMSPRRAVAQLWVFPAASRWLLWLLPVLLCVISPLRSICQGYPMPWLNQTLIPCHPGWLLLSWFPSALAGALPWLGASLGSGEGNRQSSSHRQGPVTRGHSWWYSWERDNFAELQQHLSSGGVPEGEIAKGCSKHLRGK